MARTKHYDINPTWALMLNDIGLRPADILRRAGLAEDLFARDKAELSADDYFALWRGMQEESGDPEFPIKLASRISVESFDPAIFAALCSPDLNTAAERIARYKRLVCPMTVHVNVGDDGTRVEFEWAPSKTKPPAPLIATELAFFTQLARIGTRAQISPLEVRTPVPQEPKDAYESFFGATLRRGARPMLRFSARDASRPFLTANNEMWKFFEPELQRRLSELDSSATTTDRVRAALLELLPSGTASVDAVSRKLAVSHRTLQRKLREESVSFQALLNSTREELAMHYLKTADLSGAEISFLLGFKDPNSFFRAFRDWTGQTPEQVRGASLQAH